MRLAEGHHKTEECGGEQQLVCSACEREGDITAICSKDREETDKGTGAAITSCSMGNSGFMYAKKNLSIIHIPWYSPEYL